MYDPVSELKKELTEQIRYHQHCLKVFQEALTKVEAADMQGMDKVLEEIQTMNRQIEALGIQNWVAPIKSAH